MEHCDSNPSISDRFPRYTQYEPVVPVWCVTPNTPRTIHRYYDSTPFSPSGHYLVTTQLPYEDKLPRPGDTARVFITDLTTGEERCVAETRGWDTQLGAHVHWDVDDRHLFFNDLDTRTWTPFGVRLNWESGARDRFDGPIYDVSSDRKFAVSPCLARTVLALRGYGVVVPPEFVRRPDWTSDDDGFFITDLTTGEYRQLISMRQIIDSLRGFYGQFDGEVGEFVGFHVTVGPQTDWILAILRWIRIPTAYRRALWEFWRQFSRVGRKAAVMTKQDWLRWALLPPKTYYRSLMLIPIHGGVPRVILPANEFELGGHHPNWCPDRKTIVMNRVIDKTMRFCRYHLDSDHWEVMSNKLQGTGHPTLHPNGRHIITDSYPFERVAYGDGTVPIRLVDWKTETERTIVRVPAKPNFYGPNKELRVDPHPAWNSNFTRLAFNAFVHGTRHVYCADLSDLNLGQRS